MRLRRLSPNPSRCERWVGRRGATGVWGLKPTTQPLPEVWGLKPTLEVERSRTEAKGQVHRGGNWRRMRRPRYSGPQRATRINTRARSVRNSSGFAYLMGIGCYARVSEWWRLGRRKLIRTFPTCGASASSRGRRIRFLAVWRVNYLGCCWGQ